MRMFREGYAAMNGLTRLLYRLRRDEQGMIFVEAGVVMSFLVLFLILVYDVGGLFVRQMQITNALRAGSQYALVRKPVAGDYANIRAAILNAAPEAGVSPVVTADVACQCADGSTVACDAVCTDGSDRESYLTVSYQENYNMLFKYPGFSKSITLGATNSVRLN